MFTEKELEVKSILYRKKILESIKKANAGHTAGSLSCIDILSVLYNRILNVSPETFNDPDRDRYIQSKGHSIEALYVVLADRGFILESDLDTLAQYQSHYVGHPTRKVNGIEQNTGALGHGLSVSVGLALGAKKDNASHRVFTLLGDGELTEGSNWEALLAGAHYNLDNLTAVVDYNTLQITGRITDVLKTDPLEEKFRAFGWAVRHVNGHNVAELSDVLLSVPFETGTPSIVIARTVKGKGITFMEDAREWHHKVPDDDQYSLAMQELDEALAMYESTVDTDRGRM